jgi:hypothetical protein
LKGRSWSIAVKACSLTNYRDQLAGKTKYIEDVSGRWRS